MMEVKFGTIGLCLSEVGETKYNKMAAALMKILYGHLIPHQVDQFGKLDQLLLNAKNKNLPPMDLRCCTSFSNNMSTHSDQMLLIYDGPHLVPAATFLTMRVNVKLL